MSFILNFNSFINEATMGDDKIGKVYMMNANGISKLNKFIDTDGDVILTPVDIKPMSSKMVILIKNSTVSIVEFSQLEDKEIIIFRTNLNKYKFAVVIKGKVSLIKQRVEEGSWSRSNHFRETAFIITFAIEAWKLKNVKINIYIDKLIKMNYNSKGCSISNTEGYLVDEYSKFMNKNKAISNGMRKQCFEIINHIGNNTKNISYVVKNSTKLLINQMSSNLLKDEVNFIKGGNIDGGIKDIPTKSTSNILSRWNPSDMWIVFNDAEWTMNDEESYELNGIDTLEDINSYLGESIISRRGLIGVSLKLSEKGDIRLININSTRTEHRIDRVDISNSKKTVTIHVSFRFGNTSRFVLGTEVHVRTFESDIKSNINFEVKGTTKAKYMSGKGGSILETIIPKEQFSIKEYIRLNEDKRAIKNKLLGYKFYNSEYEKIFNNDLNSPGLKTSDQNSRMQSIIVIDWLYSLSKQKANSIISKIIRYAKSESEWAAPHLVVK